MNNTGNRLTAEEIIHVVADVADRSLHYLYVQGGYLVGLNVITGELASVVALPSSRSILEKFKMSQAQTTGPSSE